MFLKTGISIPLSFLSVFSKLAFFTYNASHNNFCDYFLSGYGMFHFWNVEFYPVPS